MFPGAAANLSQTAMPQEPSPPAARDACRTQELDDVAAIRGCALQRPGSTINAGVLTPLLDNGEQGLFCNRFCCIDAEDRRVKSPLE